MPAGYICIILKKIFISGKSQYKYIYICPTLICFSACIVVRSSMASVHFPGLHHHPAGDATGKEGHV